jgi:hypothetical protein
VRVETGFIWLSKRFSGGFFFEYGNKISGLREAENILSSRVTNLEHSLTGQINDYTDHLLSH